MAQPRTFCWLSAPGASALAVLCVHGQSAWDPGQAGPHARWLTGPACEPLEQAVACRVGEHLLITCHGGAAVRNALERALAQAGFAVAPPNTATLLGATSRLQASLLALLPQVQGRLGATLLLQALAGGSTALASLAALPRPELLQRLAAWDAARFLFQPPRVQLWGPVNAGKSSLLNALCGSPLAATGDEPGLTRDVIEGSLEHRGAVLRLFDAPGIRADASGLELAAVTLAEQWRRQADLTLLLVPPGGMPAPVQGTAMHVFSRADEWPAPQPSVSTGDKASLQRLLDRLVEHFLGPVLAAPPTEGVLAVPGLRQELASTPDAAAVARHWLAGP